MDAQYIGALAALFAAAGTFLNAVQNVISYHQVRRESLSNREISTSNNTAISQVATQVSAVNIKVDAVAENTNGHMSTLLAAVAPIDPALATAAALKIVETAEKAAEKLKSKIESDDPPATP